MGCGGTQKGQEVHPGALSGSHGHAPTDGGDYRLVCPSRTCSVVKPHGQAAGSV